MRVQLEKDGAAFVLEGKPLARGGEASVYEVAEHPALVAKVYHRPSRERADKLAVMIAAPPADPMAAQGHASIAWPTDRLLGADGDQGCVGFIMPRVWNARPLFEFYNPKVRLQVCPLFHYGYLMRTARNLCAAIHAIHERGYVIGDVNESNILVTNQALVTLVDTDSFQVAGEGRTFRCPVGKPDYTPPELYGARYADMDRKPEHDAFGLAVLIFQLLMQGVHPFAGKYTGQGEPAGIPRRIAAGHWPYAQHRAVPYVPSPHAPALDVLPPRLQELVRRCFEDGHDRPAARPPAAAWHEALREAEKELQLCPVNRQHIFNKALLICPWCDLAVRQGRDPFPSPEDVQAGNVGIPLALPVPDETPAEAALTVLPAEEPPSEDRAGAEPNVVLQLLLSPLWLCVLALIGLIILLVAILHARSARTSAAPPAVTVAAGAPAARSALHAPR
jgi:DNA-binding helix-hairpin-helix protein with protein kinase domain